MRVRRLEVGTHAGFSLLEVVIAIGILSFGMLGLALMQLYSLSQSSLGRHTGDAASIGRSYVEQVQRLPWVTLTGVSGAGWQVPGWAAAPNTTVQVNGPQGLTNEQAYTVNWRVTPVAGTTCVLNVEVRVTWQEESLANPKNSTLATRRYNSGGATC